MDISFFKAKEALTTNQIISLSGLMPGDIYEILSLATKLKTMESYKESIDYLSGGSVVLLTSTHVGLTRLLFKLAVSSIGGNEITLPLDGKGIEGFLSAPETPLVLPKLNISAFVVNTLYQSDAANLSKHLELPIINANEQDSPVQALSLILTVYNKLNRLSGLNATLISEDNKLTNLAVGLAKVGVNLTLVTPDTVNFSEDDINYLSQFVEVQTTSLLDTAIKGSDIVFIDSPSGKFNISSDDMNKAKETAVLLHNAPCENYNDIDGELFKTLALGDIGENYLNIERAILALIKR